jgi:PAS domain S-box-containing protein
MSDESAPRDRTQNELTELRRRLAEAERRLDALASSEAACKRAEEALQGSQSELFTVFDSAPVAMILVDQERRVRKANRTAIEFGNRPAEEMIGLRGGEALRCLHSLDDPRGCGFGPSCADCVVRRAVLDTFETGKSHYQVEAALSFIREGTQNDAHLLVSTTPITIAESQLVLVSIEDITEYKRGQEEISWLAKFPSENPNPVLRVARDCTILYANEASSALLDTWERQVSQCLTDEWYEIILDVLTSGSGKEVEVEVQGRIISLTLAPVPEADYVNLYGFDITERRQAERALQESEARYWDLYENAPNAYFSVGTDGCIRRCNKRAGELLGYAQEELVGRRVFELYADGSQGKERAIGVFQSFLAGERVTDEELLMQKAGGTPVWISLTVNAIRGADGQIVESRSMVVDITERRRAEEALRQYAAELEARNEELDAFAHTAAHDLKNPLGLAIGYADILAVDYPDLPPEDAEKYIHEITRNGRRMGRIIDELLLLAGVRQAEVEMEPLDMAGIVNEAQQRLVDVFEEHQVEVVLPKTWPTALGYGPWIEEVWVNYLSNAVRYGGRPPRVELGAEELSNGDGPPTVRFWVRDNGPGLAPEEKSRLFRPFTRLDQAHTKGHGLGLSIVRRIVEKLGGQVGVESEEGGGSLFSFTLPGLPEIE